MRTRTGRGDDAPGLDELVVDIGPCYAGPPGGHGLATGTDQVGGRTAQPARSPCTMRRSGGSPAPALVVNIVLNATADAGRAK